MLRAAFILMLLLVPSVAHAEKRVALVVGTDLVEDCWHDNYQGVPMDGSAWTTRDCTRCVRRGGSWISHPSYLRSAKRDELPADGRSYQIGFRLARTLE
jgi:formylglycine-generating enzyme required for sulfatase activity